MFAPIRRARNIVWALFAPWVRNAAWTAVTDGLTYQHFAEGVLADDGAEVVNYVDGDNHGTRNDSAIFTYQKLDSASDFVLDGDTVVGGIATFGSPTEPFLYASDDETDTTFTFTGTLDGSPKVFQLTGPQRTDPNASYYRRKYLGTLFDTVSQVSTDKATNGEVYSGTKEAASDYCSIRIVGGQVTEQVISEGRTSDRRHYWGCMGKHVDGTLVSPISIWDGDADPGKNYIFRSEDNGLVFDNDGEIIYTGLGSYTTPFIQYTPPTQVPGSTDLVWCVQRSGKSFWVRSADKCSTAAGAEFINCPDISFTNIETIDVTAKYFGLVTSAGNLAPEYAANDFIGLSSGGNNNNVYSVSSATYGVDPIDGLTRTMVTVNETIASAVVAGRLRTTSISEHALVIPTANQWIVVGRVNGVVASMYAWKTEDAGATWTKLGRLGLQRSGGWVSPYLSLQTRADGIWIILWLFARTPTSAPPPNAGHLVCYAMKLDAFLANPALLGAGTPFVIGASADETYGRSGYPTPLVDPITGVGSVVWATETATNKAKLVRQYVNLNTYLDSIA